MNTSLAICYLLLLVNLITHILPAKAEQVNWLDIPIRFVGDRKCHRYVDRYSHLSKDQVIGSQSIWFGKVHVAVKLPNGVTITDKKLLSLGGKRITESTARSKFYQELEQQLVENSAAVVLNHDANNGLETPWNIFLIQHWYVELQDAMKCANTSQLPIFVHGCCMSQKAALEQAAQIELALGIPVVEFDWASVGTLSAPLFPEINSYRRSERSLEISDINFQNFIDRSLKEFKPEQITLIGHSMGNRLLINLLRQLPSDKKINQVHFLRPDLSFQAFLLDEKRLCSKALQFFVYFSHNDPWLKRSEFLSGGIPRLGRPEKLTEVLNSEGLSFGPPGAACFIDVSSLLLGHSIPYSVLSSFATADGNMAHRTNILKVLPNRERILKLEKIID